MSRKIEWPPEISSDFAILDVKNGRNALDQMLIGQMGKLKPTMRLLIEAEVDYAWGGDDGISQEFALDIKSMRWKP